MSCVQQATSSQTTLPSAPDLPTQESTNNEPGPAAADVDKWAEDDEDEYVGVDDERLQYKDLMSGEDTSDQDYVAGSDDDDRSESSVDDKAGCQSNVHVTDIENPNIDVGVTFEDGQCFKRCIRQYAVLNEVELAAPHSDASRYRAHCKAKKCKWRIHASRLQDGRTWMVSYHVFVVFIFCHVLMFNAFLCRLFTRRTIHMHYSHATTLQCTIHVALQYRGAVHALRCATPCSVTSWSSAVAAYDYEPDPRWAEYRASSAVPPHLASHPHVRAHLQHKFYRRFVDPDFVGEGMSSTTSSQPSASPGSASTSASDNARPPDPGTNSAGPARSRLALQLDQRSLHFSVSAWVLIVALIGILPMAPRQLRYKGYRLSLLGTTCTTGYALFAFYGLPRAGNMQAVQAWCHHVTSSKDFIPFMYSLMFVTSKLHLKLVLVPVICWALEHVARFLRRHFTNSSLYRTYLEQPCTWVETNITAVNFLRSNAEILLGFLLILSLFSRQRNAMQTFMYWQLLKLMYHSPFTAGYHRAIWLKIGRTVNPYIHRYTPFLHDPINAGMRWWFR